MPNRFSNSTPCAQNLYLNIRRIFIVSLILTLCNSDTRAQYSFADTLRGSLTKARTCYDVNYYHLNIDILPSKQNISGYNDINFKVLETFDSLQLDLFSNLSIDSIIHRGKPLQWRRQGNAFFVFLHANHSEQLSIRVYYHGKPQKAVKPPWDGGFVWEKDMNRNDWIGVACQGTGASCWWPCKDHQSDEPDSMRITVSYPASLTCVCNGRLEKETQRGNIKSSTWRITYPINNYNVTLNIADYIHFSDTCLSGGKKLSLDYYVLRYNEDKARQHFKQVPVILACYEQAFGPYPFINDGYKLVETPYWGMEHQSCISYGNAFINSNWDVDFIILHETAHEWWGNNLTVADNADMWIHEGLGTYAEALFIECRRDADAMLKYMWDMRWRINNKFPVVGAYGVNYQGIKNDNDMYYKGAWIIQTFRTVINNDNLFFAWLKALQNEYARKPASTESFISYTNQFFKNDYTSFFNYYLYQTSIPMLAYSFEKNKINAKFENCPPGFSLPVEFEINGKSILVNVTHTTGVVYSGKFKKSEVKLKTSSLLINTKWKKRL